MTESPLFDEKVAIITGAASGIGAATAMLLAKQGAAVCIADIDDERGEAVAATINAEGGRALFLPTDVSDAKQLETMVAKTVAHFGRLDILNNNAWWAQPGSVIDLDEDGWDRTLAISLKSAFLASKYAIPAMLASGGGVIIHIGSVHALEGYSNFAAYDAAKGGLTSLTKAMAIDHSPDIRVNVVHPGTILTPCWHGVSENDRKRVAEGLPAKRLGRPEEVAQAVAFLASAKASYITGAALTVDGGLSCQSRIDQTS